MPPSDTRRERQVNSGTLSRLEVAITDLKRLGNAMGFVFKKAHVQVLQLTKNEDSFKSHTYDKLLCPKIL